jgi:hypothetical protein
MAFSFNVVKIEQGRFGNEMKMYIGEYEDTSFGATSDYLLDTMRVNITVTKRQQDDTQSEDTETTTRPVKRDFEAQVHANYRGTPIDDTVLQDCMGATEDIKKKYKVKFVQSGSFELDRVMTITTSNNEYKNNAVEMLNFTLKDIRE